MNRYITELLGTYFLVFTICMAVATDSAMAPLVIGLMLTALVYMGGHISGAHYNPAVTIAFYLRGSFQRGDILPYFAAQIFGAWLAASTAQLMTGATFSPGPGPGYGSIEALLAEIVMTFLLVLVILNVATARSTEGNQYYGVAIGFTVAGGAWAVGGISSGVFNPAVGIGPIMVDSITGDGSFAHLWIYLVGPILGALGAVPVFRLQNPDDA